VSEPLRIVEVVAGVIFDPRRERVLLALRKPSQHQGDRWEFPGGKIEEGESETAALARELQEELGIRPDELSPRTVIEHAYADKTVRLAVFDVTRFTGRPEGLEAQTLRWVPIAELAGMPFPEANRVVVEALVSEARAHDRADGTDRSPDRHPVR